MCNKCRDYLHIHLFIHCFFPCARQEIYFKINLLYKFGLIKTEKLEIIANNMYNKYENLKLYNFGIIIINGDNNNNYDNNFFQIKYHAL